MNADFRTRLKALASHGIFIGTSSWKYPGWCGLIYDEQRYQTRSKFSQSKFDRECLAEYAETFSAVCVDAGYYQFPSDKWIGDMCAQVPEGFQFGFKVTDAITLKNFPNLPRFGERAGRPNENFLNADLFKRAFLPAMEAHREKIGPLMFEFSTFKKGDFGHGREFIEALDLFLGQLPKGWKYGVEIRNKTWLQPEYFDMLRTHGVAHIFNDWTKMPPILEQLEIPGAHTAAHDIARFLVTPGRSYEASVAAFEPYSEIREPNESVRAAGRQLLAGALQERRKCTIYVNNRLEGCAPLTIAAFLERLPPVRFVIEVRPENTGWSVVSETMSPRYPNRDHAISFAVSSAQMIRAEVHILKADGSLEKIIKPEVSNE